MDAANGVPQVAPGLLAWLEAVCDWELNRRAGRDYPQPPEAAIPPEEDAASVDAVLAMRTTFFVKDSPTVRAFFDALVELLTGGSRKQ